MTVHSPDGLFDPLQILAVTASRIRDNDVGTLVTEPLRRHPMAIAQSFVTLDHISSGHAVLGIGNGKRENTEPYGLPWDHQVSRLDEALRIIRMLWESGGKPVDFEGNFWTLKDAVFDLPLYKNKAPRIFLGAHFPRMLRNADYEIVVSNTGDTALNNVVVTDTAPAATTIVAAPGASLSGNKATWTVNLQPGEKKSLSVKLASKTAGNHCNTVTAAAGGLSSSAEACTVWKGIAAVLLEAVDDPDPIQVGETTTYTIRVTNQGFADINNVKIVYKSGERTQPVSSAQGTVSGKDVNFPTVAKLAAKQVVTYTINVKGIATGDSRNKIVLTCDELTSPVEETESTTVY